MSTRRGSRGTKRGESVATSAGLGARQRLYSRVTLLGIEQVLAELGIDARMSDIVAKAQSIENGIIQSRARRKPEQMC